MKPWIRKGLLLASISLAAPTASAQSGLFDWLDLRFVDRSEIGVRDVATDPPIVRASEVRLAPESAPPSPDQSLARPVSQLGLDAAGLRRIPTTTAGLQSRDTSPAIDLPIAGAWLRMAVVEQKTDRDFDAIHMTLLAIDSSDYARLTISRSGPEIVGTAFIDDQEYRILPDYDEYQLVYPVIAHNGAWRRESRPDYESRAGLLEARHLQIGWVADRRPGNFATRADGRPHIYAEGPSIGKLNFSSAFEFNPAGDGTIDKTILAQEVEIYLNGLSHFTWILGPEARQASRIALRDTYGVEAIDDILDQNLGYRVISQTELELSWRFLLEAECGIIFLVDIDAVTGEPIRVAIADAAGITGRNTEEIIFRCQFFPRQFRQR